MLRLSFGWIASAFCLMCCLRDVGRFEEYNEILSVLKRIEDDGTYDRDATGIFSWMREEEAEEDWEMDPRI
jgi:hypothetical protein